MGDPICYNGLREENTILEVYQKRREEKPMIDPMQLMRISEHPIDISDNLIVYDDLEHGRLTIYEQLEGPVTVQQLESQFATINNVVPLAEVIIGANWKEEGVFIHKISCEYGHENLIEHMINQVILYADFYNHFNVVGISDREYGKWFSHAKDTLANFKKNNRVYEHWLDEHGEE